MVEQKERWEEMITSIDLTHNSRKAWNTIKSISNDLTMPTPPCLVNANQVVHQLLVNGRGNMPTKPKRPILSTEEQSEQSLVHPFTEEEYWKGIMTPENNKAAGIDVVALALALADGGNRRTACPREVFYHQYCLTYIQTTSLLPWNTEYHLYRRSLCHSPVYILHRGRRDYRRCTEGNHKIIQI